MKVISLEVFRHRGKQLEFAWSFEPSKFYPIFEHNLKRVYELLSFSPDLSIELRSRVK